MTVPKAAGLVIPTIDIAPYLKDASSAEATKIIQQVKEACMTTGFFSLVGHGISKELQARLFKAAETLFALPLEEKKSLVHPPLKSRGYELIGSQSLQQGTLPDLKEGFYIGRHIDASDPRAKKHPFFLGENIFPAEIPAELIKDPTEEYYDAIFNLSLKVLEILARGLPYGDDIFKDFVSDDPICAVRLLHYPPQESEDAKQLGAGAHTDFGAITLLLQDSSGGLEVMDLETCDWIPVEPNPDAYVVNIGDMLDFWTKGIYRSSIHRVINKSGRDRYSVPFFFDGRADVKLAPFDGSEALGGRARTVEEHMLDRFGAAAVQSKKESEDDLQNGETWGTRRHSSDEDSDGEDTPGEESDEDTSRGRSMAR